MSEHTSARTEPQYRALFASSRDAMLLADGDHTIRDCNRALREQFGYDAAALRGSSVERLVTEPAAIERLGDALPDHRNAERTELSLEFTRNDGGVFTARTQLIPETGAGRDGYFAVIRESPGRDRLHEQLTQSQAQLQALFESVPDPVTYVECVDGDPILRDVNPAFERTFGYEVTTAVGESAGDLIVPPDAQASAAHLETEPPSDGPVQREIRRVAADGPRDFLFRAVPIGDQALTTEYFGIYVDITDQKATERALERKNERLDEFASIVSHDLRNPLNVARGRVSLAREQHDSADLVSAETALDRMEELISDLLALAREGDAAVAFEPVDLPTVVDACWQNVETGDAVLRNEVSGTVRADQSRLQQLVENLLRNAIDHGGTDVTITVGRTPEGFYVADDGPGIPVADRDEVFTAGYTTASDGNGFGLRIVQKIVTAHDWTISIAESDSSGARFDISGVNTVSESGAAPE